jgi:putative transposase
LPGYDYARTGPYFVTICTNQRECVLGDVVDGEVRLSELGSIVREEWLNSGKMRAEIELDAFTVMPNHVHGIVIIRPSIIASARLRRGARPYARTTATSITGVFCCRFQIGRHEED